MKLQRHIELSREDVADFSAAARAEWLLTNGIGGFACGTVAGACTRRYHGLLVAALQPPAGRTVMVAKCETELGYRDRRYALTANEYVDGTIHPQGYQFIERFALFGQIPEWTYVIGDLRLRQRIWMAHEQNTTFMSFEVLSASTSVFLELQPLCTYRDYHAHAHADTPPTITSIAGGCEVRAHDGATPYRLTADLARFEAAPVWHRHVKHRLESERGLDDHEDLFRPGVWRAELRAGETVNFTLTAMNAAEAGVPVPRAFRHEEARQSALVANLAATTPPWIQQLALAADQFVASRGEGGATIIAGYPWFTDWGRDTMIALPGLTLATGRGDLAAQILRTFAEHVSEGMLPNRFPDSGEAPEYNTVDATLWFFDAVDACLTVSGDRRFAREIYPVLTEIIAWHRRGTRYGIRVDDDGLLTAGVSDLQLTWMDAKIGDWVVTPRIGKPVEINALWQHALGVTAGIAKRIGEQTAASDFRECATAHAESFAKRFWYEQGGYLYDVTDTPDGVADASLRPNQIFAVALGDNLLTPAQREAVVATCLRELWTPHGLRSLATTDQNYRGSYLGGPGERDARYHQGTTWSWLLGPFARAHFRVHRDADAALALLSPIGGHLRHACLGQISEIFDGDEPNSARGCFAQAWSVGTILDAWLAIDSARHEKTQGEATL